MVISVAPQIVNSHKDTGKNHLMIILSNVMETQSLLLLYVAADNAVISSSVSIQNSVEHMVHGG